MGLSTLGSLKPNAYATNHAVENGWVGGGIQLISESEAVRQQAYRVTDLSKPASFLTRRTAENGIFRPYNLLLCSCAESA